MGCRCKSNTLVSARPRVERFGCRRRNAHLSNTYGKTRVVRHGAAVATLPDPTRLYTTGRVPRTSRDRIDRARGSPRRQLATPPPRESAFRNSGMCVSFNPTATPVRHRDAPPSGVDGTVRPLPWRPRGSPDRPRRPKGFVVTLEVCADYINSI